VVWNERRGGTAAVVHAASTDGGRHFGAAEVVTALARATGFSQPVVAPEVGGRLEARIARWEQRALPVLEGLPPNLALEAAANALGAAVIVYPGGDPAFTHIDVPEDLLLAASLVEARRKKPRAVV